MKGWHFARADMRLGYDDGREIRDGETLTVTGQLVMCEHGLHFSERIIDALAYARGPNACRVEGPDDALNDGDKRCGAWRKCLWHLDAADILRAFARRCALDVIGLWDAPDVVRRYLETGDESIREAAWLATLDDVNGGRGAAGLATAAAGWVIGGRRRRAAVGSLAWYAAWAATWDAACAGAVANGGGAAARDAALDKYGAWLEEMVVAGHAREAAGEESDATPQGP